MSGGIISLTQSVVPIAAGAHVVGLHWLGGTLAFALADGSVLLVRDGASTAVAAHPDAGILVAAADGRRIVTGGDDGRVVATDAKGAATQIASAKGYAWIDALALHGDGGLAFSAGRNVVARDAKGREKTFAAPSSARGLAFAPKGYRLAVAHYNGVSLWYPNLETAPEVVEWKGSHLDVVWSSDGRFVITTMQENALHGWRLQPDRGHMRMSGYPAKVRSTSWSHDGDWLATGGAEAAIVWPFDTKEGPTGKAPRECGVRPARVSRVAFHPKALVLAIGYEDGCILLVRFADASELLVRPAEKGSAVSALAWDARGDRLGFGCVDGRAGLLDPAGLTVMALFGVRRPRPQDETRRRIESWVRAVGTFADGTVVKINEIVCPDPACPGFETVILIMEPGMRTRARKIAKPATEIDEADVTTALREA